MIGDNKMTGKRFIIDNGISLDNKVETYELSCIVDNSNKTFYFIVDSIANVESFVGRLNKLAEENEQLKSEINMLKTTICRNEAYITRVTNKSDWQTTANYEKELEE